MTLVTTGFRPVLKFGSAGPVVRHLQRALNAATPGTALRINGVFAEKTDAALRAWQRGLRRPASGVANPGTWADLAAGKRP